MLAANEAVARHFRERGLDTVWRVHDVPKEDRLADFASIANAFGIHFDAEDGKDPRKLRELLDEDKGRPMERAINFLLLRSLKQAVYDVVNLGHFGLGARDYLQLMAQESSQAERRAMEAEREVVDMYRAFLMRDRIGEEFEGVIAGVT